jgi:hypothetical protein
MCGEALPLSEFAPKMGRCRPCDAGYSRKRRAQAGQRKAAVRVMVQNSYFSACMAACALSGGCANAPPVISPSFPVDGTVTKA